MKNEKGGDGVGLGGGEGPPRAQLGHFSVHACHEEVHEPSVNCSAALEIIKGKREKREYEVVLFDGVKWAQLGHFFSVHACHEEVHEPSGNCSAALENN